MSTPDNARRVAVAGASGLIGTAAVEQLRAGGDDVVRLVRRPAAERDERQWDPSGGWIDGPGLTDVDAVICLSGASIAPQRWTENRREVLRSSRLDPTNTIVAALADAPRCRTFLSGSAVGFYGNRNANIVTEDTLKGRGFLPDLVADWEAAAAKAPDGVRVVYLRTSLVLSDDGGLLEALATVFWGRLGGKLGSGEQYMPWITAADHARAQRHLLSSELAGPVNLSTPDPVKNAEFTKALAAELNRPAIFTVPLAPLRLALGADLVNELIAVSQRVVPARLTDDGFEFTDPQLRPALARLLAR